MNHIITSTGAPWGAKEWEEFALATADTPFWHAHPLYGLNEVMEQQQSPPHLRYVAVELADIRNSPEEVALTLAEEALRSLVLEGVIGVMWWDHRGDMLHYWGYQDGGRYQLKPGKQ